MITSVHHIGCLVPDVEEAIADYKILHPVGEVSALYVIEEQMVKVQFLKIENLFVEFVEPIGEQSSLYRQLKKNPGFYHIGIFTSNIDEEIDRLVKGGYRLLNKFPSPAFGNKFCAFLYNLEMHLVELIEM